ncbi:hypothetical protein LCGC14_1850910 [marine sediment metagenome]|uniref:Uncharacterized protein n=1 Tax=marine sediment metagenome TaxID=412755 RepID=A0A0F9GYQ0_9ZZZZ
MSEEVLLLKEIRDYMKELIVLVRTNQIKDTLKVEDKTYVTEDIEPKVGLVNIMATEEVIQDLTEVTPMLETPKSLLCVKNGYMKYVPFQYIVGFDPEKKPYILGQVQDIELKKEGKWIIKKSWDKYKVMKA